MRQLQENPDVQGNQALIKGYKKNLVILMNELEYEMED